MSAQAAERLDDPTTDAVDVWADLAHEVDAVLARPKAQAIMDAASHLFLLHGYAATSMDAITREAGVSKATVYEHFGSKEELFRAMVACACWRHARMQGAPSDGRPLREWLTETGLRLIRFMLSDEAVGIYRCVVAEAGRTPSLGQSFFAAGPMRVRRLLAERLEEARARGEIAFADTERAVSQLLGLIRGDLHLRALFALPLQQDPSAMRADVEAAVDLFLRGCGLTAALTAASAPR